MLARARVDAMTGRTISNYRIEAKIGQGGMGVVYRAEDLRLRRPVALKFLPPGALDSEVKARFIQEAETAARLVHPNICPVYELVEEDGYLFFAMALLGGETLSERIRSRPLATDEVIDVGIQIASGLEAAHRHNIIHRDIKSRNIVIEPEGGHAYILDFGLALLGGSTRLTMPGGVMGTPSYMSPEQATGETVDHRTDIWSLGVVLFEMCTGRRPFDRDKDLGTVYTLVNESTPPLPGVPAALAAVVERALEKDPAKRWQSADDLAGALRRARNRQGEESPTTTRTVYAPPAPPDSFVTGMRRRWPILASAGVIALGLLGYWQRGSLLHSGGTAIEKHIALLPFAVIGGDENLRAIADGVVDTLTSRLSQFEDLQKKLLVVPASEIRSRNISSAQEAHQTYGATLAVTGSVQLMKNVALFNVNLIDAVNMRQLGSRSFTFDANNPIGIREEALTSLLNLLNVELAAGRPPATGETGSPAAYAAYLKGRGFMARYDVAGNLDRAIESFQAATQADPQYALAFTGLAEACWRKALDSGEKQWAARATEAALEAVKLDGRLAIAHARLGDIYAQTGHQEEAIAQLRKALQLEPANAEAHRGLAGLYANMGRFSEAEASYLQVTRYRPTDWLGFLNAGVFYWDRNRYAEAEGMFRTASNLTPNNDIVHRNMAGLFVTQGKYQEARDEAQKVLRLKPSARAYSLLGLTYYFQGRYPEAAAALEASVEMDSSYAIGWGNLGSVYRRIPGNEAKAKAALGRAVELAEKRLAVTPLDHNVRANLAEYKAKLGNAKGALAEIERIPGANRGAYWGRLAVAYELAGERKQAVEMIEAALQNAALPNEVKNDPDLAGALAEPSLARALAKSR